MKRKLIFGLTLLCSIFVVGCSSSDNKAPTSISDQVSITGKPVEQEISITDIDNKYDKIDQVYDQTFQDKVKEEIQKLKDSEQYTFNHPLLISNPYCTITDGLYLYFKTDDKVQIQYSIATDKFSEFKQVIYENATDNLSTVHETTLIGIVPNMSNVITLTMLDKSGKELQSIKFTYDAPAKLGANDDVQATIKKGESTQPLENGLYAILGNDLTNDDKDGNRIISFYDNEGVLRCEIPILEYRSNRILFDKDGMYFSIDHSKFARMDRTGYINRIYNTAPYEQHHDLIFGTNNDLLILGSDPEGKTTEDLILDLDLKSGEVKNLIDLKDYFPNYYSLTSLPKGQKQIDWMHINSLTLTDDGKLLLSSRETSTIITFDNFYSDSRKVVYMMGSDNFWKGTGYENLLYKADGDFSLNSGQHNITFIKDSKLEAGSYYLILYNNNNTVSTTRPAYNWSTDQNYKDTGLPSKPAKNSYYYKYLVNENTKTFKLINSIPVAYSGYVSSIQDLNNGNVVVDSGSALSAYEFDSNNKLIQTLTVSGNKWTYRIFKYDFSGYWFADMNK